MSRTANIKPKYKIDFALLFVVLILLCMGLIFIYSSSAYWGEYYKKDSFFYFKRQLIFTGFGMAAMGFLAAYYHKIKKFIKPYYLLIFIWILLVIALLSEPVANVHRWIKLGPLQLQPSEFAKIAVLIFMADYLDKNKSKIMRSAIGLLPVLIPVCITLALISISPDLGTPILIFIVSLILLHSAGAKFKYILPWFSTAVLLGFYEIFRYEYRWKRFLSFLSPEQNVLNEGYHISQSLTAVGSGGLLGKGLGASTMKLMYLPAGHTDFIFSIISEEMGFLGAFIIILLFCFLLIRGVQTAVKAWHFSDAVLALGITLTITLQAFINMSVSLGLVPTKGLPLPFFSYGGSSVLSSLILIGILLNITARQNKLKVLQRGRTR